MNKQESAEVRDLKGGHADAGHMVNVINTINMINMINVEDLATGCMAADLVTADGAFPVNRDS